MSDADKHDKPDSSDASESSEYDHDADIPESTESDMDPDDPDDAPPVPPLVATADHYEPVDMDLCSRCRKAIASYEFQKISICKQCIRLLDCYITSALRANGVVDGVQIKAIIRSIHKDH